MKFISTPFYNIGLLFLVSTAFCAAQPCTLSLSGKVIDEHDRKPLAFAEVYLANLQQGTVVDSNGAYIFTGLCPGTYTLTAYHIGCTPVTRTIVLRENLTQFNFYPEHHSELLEETRIIENRGRTTAKAKTVLTETQIESSRGRSLQNVLNEVSGTRTMQNGPTLLKPVIHGLYGNRIVTLNQGIPQEDQQWGLEHGLTIDLFTIDDISVLKGAAATEFGAGATGGVLKLKAEDLPIAQPHLGGEAYLIGVSNGLGGVAALKLEQGLGRYMAYRVQFSGTKMGDQRAPGYYLTNTAHENWNASAHLAFHKKRWKSDLFYSYYSSTLGVLRASHIGNLTDFNRALRSDEPLYQEPFDYRLENPKQVLSHQLLRWHSVFEKNDKLAFEIRYGLQNNQRKEFDVRRGLRGGIPSNHLELLTQNLDIVAAVQHSPGWKSRYGISGFTQLNSNVPGTGIRPILPNYIRYRAGAFLSEYYITGGWQLEAGFRYDREYVLVQKFDRQNRLIRPEFWFHSLAASTGATYSFTPNTQLSSSLSLAYRPPHVNELMSEGLHHGAATIEIGDSSLRPEQSLNWSTTLSVHYPQKWQFEITAYLNPYLNYIYLSPQPEPRVTIRGTFPVQQYVQDDVFLAGADLLFKGYLNPRLTYTVNGTYLRAYNLSTEEDLILIPPPEVFHQLQYTFNFKDVKRWRQSFIALGQKYVSRQVHFPAELDLADPPPAYTLINVSLGTVLNARKNRTLEFTLSAENLLNTAYRDYLDRFRYYADQAGINLILKTKYSF